VTLIGLKADKLAGSRAFKTFGRSSIGFDLWHFFLPGKLVTYIEQLGNIQVASVFKFIPSWLWAIILD